MDVEKGLAGLDRAIPDYLSGPERRELDSLHHQVEIVDEAIERVVSFDAGQGQRLGIEIQRIHGQTRGIVVLLDAASVALAIGAAYLALRQLRRAAQAQKAEREARPGAGRDPARASAGARCPSRCVIRGRHSSC